MACTGLLCGMVILAGVPSRNTDASGTCLGCKQIINEVVLNKFNSVFETCILQPSVIGALRKHISNRDVWQRFELGGALVSHVIDWPHSPGSCRR